MSKIQIYISGHKPCFTIENEIIRPIRQHDIIKILQNGTDEDKFMAEHANEYCELLTQYWAWKYEVADYYGFGHYRRYFSFRDKNKTNPFQIVDEKYLSDKTADKHGFNDPAKIISSISGYDIIAPVPYSYQIKSVYDQYKESPKLHIDDLDFIIKAIDEYSPKLSKSAHKYLSNNKLYICNMFIMRADIFKNYSEWLFGILHKFYEYKDMHKAAYNAEATRTPGHLGERLFGIYYTWLLEQKQYNTKELNIVAFANTEPPAKFLPAFAENNIPIFMATNGYYAKFTAAALYSIYEHISDENNYDIIILHNNLCENDKIRLTCFLGDKKNFSVRFFDPEAIFENYNLYESPTITKETYYRLIIPEYFPFYDKVLYLDSDLVVFDDIAKLYALDIGENYIGGAIDICHAGSVNGFDAEMRKYYEKFHLKNIYKLINAGVLIINTAAIRNEFGTAYLLSFAQEGRFRFQDQDLLNILCEDKIFYIDSKWNFFADPSDSYRGYITTFAPKIYYDAYIRSKSDIRILHFAGNEKPWFFPNYDYAQYFWQYFRKTAYYECSEFFHASDVKVKNKQSLLKRIVFRLCPKGTRRRAWAKKVYRFFKRK